MNNTQDAPADRDVGKTLKALLPGSAFAVLVALLAWAIARFAGGSALLYALLGGLLLRPMLPGSLELNAGLDFGAKPVLRVGVALLGARISIDALLALGVDAVILVVVLVPTTILLGRLLAPRLRLHRDFGLLSGTSVGVCGASAALAAAAVLPGNSREHERQLIFVIVAVTALSTAAMVLYPFIAQAAGLSSTEIGLFLGGSIHDVAQVVGAGYSVSKPVGDAATLTKLMRVAMLLPAVTLIALSTRRQGQQTGDRRPPLLPGFLVAFAVLMGINSLGVLPAWLTHALELLSGWLLLIAIAAIGARASIRELGQMGWRPLALVVIETVFIAALAMAALVLLRWL